MKNLLPVLLLAIFPMALQAQTKAAEAEPPYIMYSSVYLSPDNTKVKELRDGIKAHKAKYHPDDGPWRTNIFSVVSGPRSGDYVWLEGPQTFTDYDKDKGEGHGPDWGQNVEQYCKDTGPTEFWKRWDDYTRMGSEPQPLVRVRFIEINLEDRQGYRMRPLYKQLSEAVKSMEGDFFWAIYSNEFQQGKMGRHFAIVTDFANWAELDEDINFKKIFDKVHGEGSFDRWQREWREVFVDSYDEYWVREAGL